MQTAVSTNTEKLPTVPLLLEIADAFNSRDADRIMSYFTEDCTFYMASGPEPVGRTVSGKAAVHKVLADRFKVIPDMTWTHEYEYVAGTRAVTVWRVTGHATDGTVLDYQGCDLWEFRDGLVVNKDTYWKIVRPD
ncbi:nuclear transport factor 2 family protein [Tardiphaga robiniae]|uniref:Nuclear transport factor 2 family protein n=1 Tax=Tardiphaga robiniae TaxID=943830 RepID=A0A7G6U1F8_9BRAD|nr:nuclear transport factor 2 family protein [Tardiphaga robiniae]QND72840.1 nuclear transport factor 2 family protein [Tardiphaga robiniae]